ncbi:transposase [Nonomuraea sp. MTCD27]|uniref:transposase n=1 Tax=Nonomuraea sp. MTCD27 TaxID=1676747 RepID=UPI0035C1A081
MSVSTPAAVNASGCASPGWACRGRKPAYPSDLADAEWLVLEGEARAVMAELVAVAGRPMVHDLRAVLDAIGYVSRYGIEWRALPVDCPPHEAVYAFFVRRSRRGVPERAGRLRGRLRLLAGRRELPTAGVRRLPDGPGGRDGRRDGLRVRRGQEAQRAEAARCGGHPRAHEPPPYTLPRERPTGKPRTHNLLFRWATDDLHIRHRNYDLTVWKPALVAAGVLPEPTRDSRGRRQYLDNRQQGTHQLRHYFAGVALAGGVTIKNLCEYLGHTDPALTLRVYAHMLPSSHDRVREAIDRRFRRPTCEVVQRTGRPVTARPMIRRWISDVPSKIV